MKPPNSPPRLPDPAITAARWTRFAWTCALLALALVMADAPLAPASNLNAVDIDLGAGSTHLTLLSDDPLEMRYEMELGELQALKVMTPEGEFARLLIPGFHSSHDEGLPELPMMNRLIEIPYGATVVVEVTSRTTREVTLADHGIGNLLFPAQPSLAKDVDPTTVPFVLDRDAYARSSVARDLVRVEDLGRMRAVRIGRLEVSPVEYRPLEGKLVVTESLSLTLRFENADLKAEGDLKARTASPFFTPLYERIEGYRDTHDDHPNPVNPIVTMVIVTWPDFAPQLQELVEWKTERGFRTILAVLGEGDVGWTRDSVQTYLRGLYESGTPEFPAPSFFLFVGDVAEMPTWTLSGDATDRPYSDMEGDLCPDVLYGRFSASNPTDLQNILDKTLMYERFTMPDPSYLGEVVMIAGMDGTYGALHGNGQINYGTSTYFNVAHGIYSHTYLYPQSGSHALDIVQNVSDGVAYVNYTAHGSQTSWSDPSFTQSQVRNLQNDGEYCLAVGNCCLTSSYQVSECFAETWLRVGNKGAIGYIGGSNSTYWDEDYWWGVGFRSVVVTNPTYEDTGTGAYDGLFHDHGEAMSRWYVVNDAIIFAGNLAVMESGSSRITYYWNIYNLMGDPSLCTYLGVPTENPVVHPETIFTTWDSFQIEAVPGSYVGFSQDGELKGAGTLDQSGALDLSLWAPLVPGPGRLVVMAQNREPYIRDLNVIIPAQVFMTPTVIDCETVTEVTIGVFEYDGTTPKPDVEIWAEGLLYQSEHATTDETGYCTITVLYDYGPSVEIVGKELSATYELFRDPLGVNASPLMGGLTVSTDIGLSGQFPLHLPGTLHAMIAEPNHTLHAFLNDAWVASTTETSLEVRADQLGTVEGVIAIVGFDLVRRSFPVVEVWGTLTGYVDANGSPGAGALVQGFDGEEMVFQALAQADGRYSVPEEIVCGPYRMEVSLFGFLGYNEPVFVGYGPNTLDIELVPAPAGTVSGTVTELGTGTPLDATVDVYRSDNGDLYVTTGTNPVDGTYAFPDIPYFDYIATVRSERHRPVTEPIAVEGPAQQFDFQLERTLANLLVIDDGSSGLVQHEAKIDDLTGAFLETGYESDESKSSADLQSDLEAIGYYVTMETMNATDPAEWAGHDLLVVASGSNVTTLASSTFRSALRAFVLNGGRLLIEGGEVGYDHYSSDPLFAREVLHINDWNHDQSGSITIATPSHPVVSEPNLILGPIPCSYAGYGDQDAVVQTSDAVRVGSWTTYPTDASLIAFEPVGSDGDGRIVYYAFNYSAVDANTRFALLENTIAWLLPQDPAGTPEAEGPSLQLALAPAQPNPMGAWTRISFAIPSRTAVDLAIYDVAGRRVRTLLAGPVEPGTHEVLWTGRDDRGLELTSGVYFYRLATEGGARIEKITRIR